MHTFPFLRIKLSESSLLSSVFSLYLEWLHCCYFGGIAFISQWYLLVKALVAGIQLKCLLTEFHFLGTFVIFEIVFFSTWNSPENVWRGNLCPKIHCILNLKFPRFLCVLVFENMWVWHCINTWLKISLPKENTSLNIKKCVLSPMKTIKTTNMEIYWLWQWEKYSIIYLINILVVHCVCTILCFPTTLPQFVQHRKASFFSHW